MFRRSSKVVEFGAKIGPIVDVISRFFFVPADLLQPELPVISHFRLGSLDFKTRIPRTPIGGAKPGAARRRVAESCIDDSVRRYSKDQFPGINPRQQSGFRLKTLVGGVIKLKDTVEKLCFIGEPGQH